MSRSEMSRDPDVLVEQRYLDEAHRFLSMMRARAAALLDEVRGAGNPDLDYEAALARRVNLLADSPRPLLFGRIDELAGPVWRIGRRHVEDQTGDPVVVDWRAPVSTPFYRARSGEAYGLTRRRQIMVDRQEVVAIADEALAQNGKEALTTGLRGGDALLAELERSRTGEMLDIVATIQAEQDEIIRAPLDELIAVQGGPGTGKTAVGLHRAAYLLYNYPPLAQSGVLVVGPSRAFLRYIAQVLPSLGEEAVVHATIGDLAPRVELKHQDPLDVGRVKGSPSMAAVLARALQQRRRPLGDDVVLPVRATRCRVPAEAVNELVESLARSDVPYKAGRAVLRSRLLSLCRQTLRQSGRIEANEPGLERQLAASDQFRTLLDHVWPSVSPLALVGDLLSNARVLEQASAGLLDDGDAARLLRASRYRSRWTTDDLALLDEAEFLVKGRKRTYGHIVVDEAQDLSPMQFRMVERRAPTGSLTVLGDLAQATGAWGYGHWDEILRHLPSTGPIRKEELTLGYRAPGQVLELASRLLPLAAPTVRPTRSIRRGQHEPRVVKVEPMHLLEVSLAEATMLAGQGHLVGLIASPGHLDGVVRLAENRRDIGILDRDGITKPVTLVAPSTVKGLEFDAVVVVEPSVIAGSDARGLRILYVAMTRPIRHLSVVHAGPMPELLRVGS